MNPLLTGEQNQSAPAIPPAPKTIRRSLMRPSCHRAAATESHQSSQPGGLLSAGELPIADCRLPIAAPPVARVRFIGWQELPPGMAGKKSMALFNLVEAVTDRQGLTSAENSTVTLASLEARGFHIHVVADQQSPQVDHFAVCLKAISDLYEEGDLEQCERVLLIAQSTLHQMRIEARSGEDGVVR